MEIKQLLIKSRHIWGDGKLTLSQIIIRMGKVFGDICRYERNAKITDRAEGEAGLKKELGNMIVSTVCWCDDLGYDPHECIDIAIAAQEDYQKNIKNV